MSSVQKKSLELMRKHLNSLSDAEFLAKHRKAKNFGGMTVDEFLSSSRYAGIPTSPSHLLGNVVYKRPAQHHHAFNVSGAQHVEVKLYLGLETHGGIPANDPSYGMAA